MMMRSAIGGSCPKILLTSRTRELPDALGVRSLRFVVHVPGDGIPPGAHTGKAVVIAVHHLQWRTQRLGIDTRPQVGWRRIDATHGSEQALMAPKACHSRQLLRLPASVVHIAATPTVLNQEIGRGPLIERRHEVIGVATEGCHNALW